MKFNQAIYNLRNKSSDRRQLALFKTGALSLMIVFLTAACFGGDPTPTVTPTPTQETILAQAPAATPTDVPSTATRTQTPTPVSVAPSQPTAITNSVVPTSTSTEVPPVADTSTPTFAPTATETPITDSTPINGGQDNTPTRTPTPTIAPTVTKTPESEGSNSGGRNNTPTRTSTPTKTSTPTITPTATKTRRPAGGGGGGGGGSGGGQGTVPPASTPTPFITPTPTPSGVIELFIWPDSLTVNPGDTFELTMRINPAGLGISGADVRIPFHTGAFEVQNIRVGSALGNDALIIEQVNNNSGVLLVAIARVGDTLVPSDAEAIILIDIHVKGGAEVRNYTFTPSGEFADHQFGTVLPDKVTSGIVTVEDK